MTPTEKYLSYISERLAIWNLYDEAPSGFSDDVSNLVEMVKVMREVLDWYSGLFGHNDDGLSIEKHAREALERVDALAKGEK
jgi:hypothetical protein